MKSGFKGMLLVLCMMCIMAFASPVCIYAASDLDGLSSGSTTNDSTSHGSSDNTSISDYLKGYNPVTQDNMEKAGTMASPIVNALGTLSGFIIMVVSAAIFVVTALGSRFGSYVPISSIHLPSRLQRESATTIL